MVTDLFAGGAGPLAGVRVLDCSRLMPFSYGTQLLVEAGASVVKVEAPGGEYGRGMASAFDLTNRGKRSITLDLRSPHAKGVLGDLVGSFDALLESFRPGYMDGLGLGYAELRRVNPSLVYCSATGYGQDGPYAQRAGHDLNYAALAGLLSFPGSAPVVPLVPFIDMAVGWATAYGVLAGIVRARLTGEGQHIDVNMADLALSLNVLAVAESTSRRSGAQPRGPLTGYPWPALMAQGCPCYGVFRTRDDRFVALANVEPKFWRTFLAAIDRPDLEGDRFAMGEIGARVRGEVQGVIGSRPLAEWDAVFSTLDICYAPVNTPEEALRDPHFAGRGIARQLDDGSWHIGSPISFSAFGRGAPGPVPPPGEANDEVLRLLGRTAADVQRWRTEGVI